MLRFVFFMAACGSKTQSADSGVAENHGSNGDINGSDSGESTGSETLTDLGLSLSDPGGCEGEQFGPDGIPGAASVFYGEYHGDETGYTGEERWYLWANQSWQGMDGEDCVVTWNAIAQVNADGACAGCDLSILTTLTLDESRSTCPEGLQDNTDGTAEYNISLRSNGQSLWSFSSTGEHFGSGEHVGNGLNFVTESTCKWF